MASYEGNKNSNSDPKQPEFQVPKPVVSFNPSVSVCKFCDHACFIPSKLSFCDQIQSGDVLKGEEEKLKAKYQLPSNWRGSGHSAFLQKKLAKGVSVLMYNYQGASTVE